MIPKRRRKHWSNKTRMKRVDFGSAIFSEVSDELVLTTYNDDKIRIYWKDKEFEADYEMIYKASCRIRKSVLASARKTSIIWIISAYSDTEPGETYLFDRKTKN